MGGIDRAALALPVFAAAAVLSVTRGEAHKPITSPFTFSEHVKPIVEAQCGRCHTPGGVAPMSLLTHPEAVPWGESMRAELLSGHMPPWSVDSAPGRFRNAQVLTAQELNVLLTWVTGGTPPGDDDHAASAPSSSRLPSTGWPLGPPDLALPFPREHTLAAERQEEVAEFTVATGFPEARWVSAVDLLPGTAAIVRAATVLVTGADPPGGRETVLALWVPGDDPVPLDGNAAFLLPAGAELIVRVLYRKTWEYERRAMSDRSTLGIYFASAPAPELRALTFEAGSRSPGSSEGATIRRTLESDVRALAVYPDSALDGVRVVVTAQRPDGSRQELIAFRPRRGWARRYWFAEPITLPRGTTITVAAQPDGGLLPPGALPPAAPPDVSTIKLTLNVVGSA